MIPEKDSRKLFQEIIPGKIQKNIPGKITPESYSRKLFQESIPGKIIPENYSRNLFQEIIAGNSRKLISENSRKFQKIPDIYSRIIIFIFSTCIYDPPVLPRKKTTRKQN